ncbi:hypothetical protein [Actinospongicola halichondriae]|uniref:hypothetical protein n=1 Tax=Actinospongicola halichondriae TaxID=3236844 RepID=UPI003D5A1035
MSLPVALSDLPYPPGDSAAIRAAAADIRSTLPSLRSGRSAALRLEAVGQGVHWQGGAFEAYRRICEREPIVPAFDRAIDRMALAAERLDWFAERFEANTATIRWCRSRLAALGLGGPVPDELVPDVQRIGWDAERAWDDHRASLANVAELFDWLDDQPTFATPPPSNWERVKGGAGHVWSFGVGVTEGTWELVSFSAEVMVFVNPLTGPLEWREAWSNREQVVAVLAFARDHPGEFATELGRSAVDLDTLTDDGVARWLGHRVPDLVLALSTGGLGTAGTRAGSLVVRGLARFDARLGQVAMRLVEGAPLLDQRFVVSAVTGRLAVVQGYRTGAALVDAEAGERSR